MWIRLATAATLVALAAAATCPSGFSDLGLNGYLCYKFVSDKNVTWTSAFTSCLTADASLLAIASRADFFPISFYVRNESADMWTGLIDISGSRTWADNTPYDPALDEFVTGGGDGAIYGYMSADDGLFHIGDGRQQHGYICYVDTTPPPTSPPPPTTTTEATTTPAPPPCDDSWAQYGDTCYLLSEDTQLWAAASHNCHQYDAEPVSVHKHEVLTFLLLQAKTTTYWIGLEDHNGTYVYEDGSSTADVDEIIGPYLDAWQPDHNCIALDPTNFPEVATHQNCFIELPYTCQKPARPGSAPFYPDMEDMLPLTLALGQDY